MTNQSPGTRSAPRPIPPAPAHLRHLSRQPPAALSAPARTRGLAMLLSCLIVLVSCLAQLLGLGSRPALAEQPARFAPLPGALLRGFQVGERNWMAGHRGVDLAGRLDQPVVAAASGTVSWAGVINGIPMLTVQHPDGLRTTYQPVTASLPAGSAVAAGQVVATLVAGHCEPQACLHWGLRDGEAYLDPLAWLGGLNTGVVRLLPRSATPKQLPPPGVAEAAGAAAAGVAGLPVGGPITSAFGGRSNPISGAAEFHDGIDIGAPCGAGVQTRWTGMATFVGTAGGYGLRVEVDHGMVAGEHLVSSYSHLSGFAVAVGQPVDAGTVVGLVGSTGYATGCHLHYSTVAGGQSIDPLAAAP